MPMQLSEQLIHTTIRLEASRTVGDVTETSIGTGFFFSFCQRDKESIPTIVTNKHVVRGYSDLKIMFSLAGECGAVNGDYTLVPFSNQDALWIDHPDPEVDLCIMPIASVINFYSKAGHPLYYTPFNLDLLPTEEQAEKLSCIDEVTMIGYPQGLWDNINNLPIVRRGITATPYKYDYRGKKEFVVDMACFPGSSGSPVFVLNQGSYSEGNEVILGNRLLLLGIEYASPSLNEKHQFELTNTLSWETSQQLNLGFVIKSERLCDFEPILESPAQGAKDG